MIQHVSLIIRSKLVLDLMRKSGRGLTYIGGSRSVPMIAWDYFDEMV